jgi:hypothetical protein
VESKLTPTHPRLRAGILSLPSPVLVLFGCLCLAALSSEATESRFPRHTREHFRHDMRATVRADHPAIAPVAAAIRAVTTNPREQLVMVNDVSHLLVDYDDDRRVYGQEEFHATLDEMLLRRRQMGWLYLRDDCDGRAVFAAHLLAALGIPWRLEASFWKEHAWVVARVGGVDYHLLDLRPDAPETDRLSYRLIGRLFVAETRRPPPFGWRRAWAERTARNLQVGLTLGLLEVGSTAANLRQRNSTDWSGTPGIDGNSPFDPRVLAARFAAFPYGEPLQVSALAAATVAPTGEPGPARGVPTASSSSGPEMPAAK